MTTDTFLNKYVDIETKCFIKKDKSVLLDNLLEQTLKENGLQTFEEVSYIIYYLADKEIKIRQPFFSKIIYPVLSHHVDLDNIGAIKLMLKLLNILLGQQELTNNHKYSYSQLIERGLSLQPNDKELLENRELTLRNYIDYTLHEVPIGVLFDNDGASIENCDELLETLKDYQNICSKLNADNSDLTNEAEFYYKAYKHYLGVFKQYNNFEHYLNELKEKQQPTLL